MFRLFLLACISIFSVGEGILRGRGVSMLDPSIVCPQRGSNERGTQSSGPGVLFGPGRQSQQRISRRGFQVHHGSQSEREKI